MRISLMPSYKAPVRDLSFITHEFLNFASLRDTLGYSDVDPETIDAIFSECARLAEDVVHPLNQSGDVEGCKLVNGDVIVPAGFKEAYQAYVEGGWGGLSCDPEFGGMGMPQMLRFMINEIFTSANHSWFMYPTLTDGAHSALEHWASDELKRKFLPKLTTGEWTGTMNLTESHAGTDLGMIRTRAEPAADGSYRISGNKIFISAGDHQMTENIVHLVLAKVPGAPEGTKGISLFIVPKFIVNDDGSLGERNSVVCQSIEHKMGIRASATCVLEFENATGYLVGEENNGLKAMFTMMNAARLGVAVEGLGSAELAYQNAVAYAKDRLQGRSLSGKKAPEKPADPLIVHADIRRMLLTMRSFAEGARALNGYIALLLDLSTRHPEEKEREKAQDLLGLMTPVAKSFFTDEGSAAANLAVQVYGGHGYICEHGVEQFVRDARISQIYEGTNGIQSLDLVGRKLGLNGGRGVRTFFAMVEEELKKTAEDGALQGYTQPMAAAFNSLQKATGWLMQNAPKNPDNLGGTAVEYTRLFSIVAVGWCWLRVAQICQTQLAGKPADADFYANKLIIGRFFMERYVSEHASLLSKVTSGADSIMALAEDAF